jgi:hypothetical protein
MASSKASGKFFSVSQSDCIKQLGDSALVSAVSITDTDKKSAIENKAQLWEKMKLDGKKFADFIKDKKGLSLGKGTIGLESSEIAVSRIKSLASEQYSDTSEHYFQRAGVYSAYYALAVCLAMGWFKASQLAEIEKKVATTFVNIKNGAKDVNKIVNDMLGKKEKTASPKKKAKASGKVWASALAKIKPTATAHYTMTEFLNYVKVQLETQEIATNLM